MANFDTSKFNLVKIQRANADWNTPIVSVQCNGDIYINSIALCLLGEPQYVEIFADVDKKAIILLPTESETEAKLSIGGVRRSNAVLRGKNALRMVGWKAGKSMYRIPVKTYQDRGIYFIVTEGAVDSLLTANPQPCGESQNRSECRRLESQPE